MIPRLSGQVEFFELRADQFREGDGSDSSLALNKNSESPDSLRSYPVVFFSRASHPDCVGGFYGSAFALGKSDQHILICTDSIKAASQNNTTLETTAIAVLTAHEVGHRFNLRHYSVDLAYHNSLVTPAAAINLIKGSSANIYAESSVSATNLFTRIRYRKQSSSGLIATLPVDDLDYSSYEDPGENTALTGFRQTSVILIDTSTPEPATNAIDFQNAVGEISHTQALSEAGSRYKSNARLLIYEPYLIMSYKFLFEIAPSDISVYSISDKINLIQLQK
jgi:hypothetical protein